MGYIGNIAPSSGWRKQAYGTENYNSAGPLISLDLLPNQYGISAFWFGLNSLYYRFIDKQNYNNFLQNLFHIKVSPSIGQGAK